MAGPLYGGGTPKKPEPEPCVRCEEQPAIDTSGLCGHCHWVTRLDIDRGTREIEVYLEKQARFREEYPDTA